MEDASTNRDPLLEMFLFETSQFLEELEEILLLSEKNNEIGIENINEIFRMMHTIKGSAAMMMFNNIAAVAHEVEDLFYFIRENQTLAANYSIIYDIVLKTVDFIREQIENIQNGKEMKDEGELLAELKKTIMVMKKNSSHSPDQKYAAKILFEEGAGMENIRAFNIVHNLKEYCEEISFRPEDIIENSNASEEIIKNGFEIYFSSHMDKEALTQVFEQALYVKSYELAADKAYLTAAQKDKMIDKEYKGKEDIKEKNKQSLISVNISKLNKLMDFVGEIVIAQSMVIKNPDLEGLSLPNFNKTTRQLRKLTDELQDIVMSIRMVPIASTFHKMERLVRDMSKKLGKSVELIILGEETEVDKNIIDHISDPLMHLIRNAVDHGIEMSAEREQKGKEQMGRIILEAQNTGGDVLIRISDDGKGLDAEKILNKARKSGLINKAERDLSQKEIYSFILLPGFSTNQEVTEFSGRGVGMDVVKKNIDEIGGNISIESVQGKGTTMSIKIPLTLAIVGGMGISVGNSTYTIPTIAIKEAFKADEKDVIIDPEGYEMIMIRGKCYTVLRLHEHFSVDTEVIKISQGIILLVESGDKSICLFADCILGEQQVVVKALPIYLSKYTIRDRGIGGCVILGDGSISLMIDVMTLIMTNE
ncbi:MAG: chemotaxis protein histidine kinaselike protein [Clostridia bacterium]|jgi:two-component system chemotaxis sensor kinase CheA|nr:chemotaxis protein histidine kinaselike protein [Clostridia bacterium]